MSTILRSDVTGAIVLPADLCRAAGVEPGVDLVAEIQTGQIILEFAVPSLADKIAARGCSLLQTGQDTLPDDLATQHDHYLYGTRKQPE